MSFIFLCIFYSLAFAQTSSIPTHFLDLKSEVPSIEVEMRYATKFNFTGKPVAGYLSNKCYLHQVLVQQLKKVQSDLQDKGLSLKVYDCYRPQKAVDQFIAWVKKPGDNKMKIAFYPNISKADLFKKKYLAKNSKHSRGHAVDVTIIRSKDRPSIVYYDSEQKNCTLSSRQPRGENSLEMGTAYDCLDVKSSTDSNQVSAQAQMNRKLLKKYMSLYGFKNYSKEWWHYSMQATRDKTYYNFDIK